MADNIKLKPAWLDNAAVCGKIDSATTVFTGAFSFIGKATRNAYNLDIVGHKAPAVLGTPAPLSQTCGRQNCGSFAFMSLQNRKWHVYVLKDPRDFEVRYVGVTFRLRARKREHLSKAKKLTTHKACWIQSLLNIGLKPIFEVIETGRGEGWDEVEQKWIAHYRQIGARLTNGTDGGEGFPGYVPPPELRQKWSRQRRGKPYPPGRRSGMLGKKHTKEARQKIAEAGRGRTISPETRKKMSRVAKIRGVSEATRQASIEARLGKPLSEEHKAKIRASTRKLRKPVRRLSDGRVFPSITTAANALGVTEASVNQAIRKGCRCKGSYWEFAK